jgi:hypothetical protein
MVRDTQIYKMLLELIMTHVVHKVQFTNLVSIGGEVERMKVETFRALKFPNFIIDKLIQSTLE